MAGIKADFINPFLMAATKILKDMCMIETKMGKPYIRELNFTDDTVIITIGVTGGVSGQVMFALSNPVACEMASKMIMMPISQLDELSVSALGELANMILGNAATMLSANGIGVDITPPTVGVGNMLLTDAYSQNICVPLVYGDEKTIEINVAIKE